MKYLLSLLFILGFCIAKSQVSDNPPRWRGQTLYNYASDSTILWNTNKMILQTRGKWLAIPAKYYWTPKVALDFSYVIYMDSIGCLKYFESNRNNVVPSDSIFILHEKIFKEIHYFNLDKKNVYFQYGFRVSVMP